MSAAPLHRFEELVDIDVSVLRDSEIRNAHVELRCMIDCLEASDALTRICRFFLDHADHSIEGGELPHVSIIVSWDRVRDGVPTMQCDVALSPADIEQFAARLANLVLLCDFHHHVVHRPGWCATFDGLRFVVTNPGGRVTGDP